MAPRLAAATVLLFVAGSAFAEPDPAKVKRAIKGGQEYLRAVYKPGGPGPGGFGPGGIVPPGLAIMAPVGVPVNGPAALAGLALLESGAGAGDAAVSNIARVCREGALRSTSTYELALIIMFLDRLGSASDEGIIQFLTLRLMSGQLSNGSWGYSCEGLPLDPVEERQLRGDLRDTKLVTPDSAKSKKDKPKPREDLDDGSKPAKKDPAPAPKEEPKEEKPRGSHPALDKFARKMVGGSPGVARAGDGDHSNTQFATVGLWCGRRHAVEVNDVLAKLDKHYRGCQGPDGGWSYTAASGTSSPSMCCAGLMGLAIGFGAKNLKEDSDRKPRLEDPEALGKDPKVVAGLKYLSGSIAAAGGNRGNPNDLSRDLYFMWSLERVGMVYGINTIGDVDWYDWGASILIKNQNQGNGSWPSDGFHGGSIDNSTAFAVLFLCRANLAADLTTKLRGKAKSPDTAKLGTPDPTKPSGSGNTGTSNPPATKVDPLPPADVDAGGRLANALVAAGAGDRDDLIAKYRDTKGGDYTDALARAASKMDSDGQAKVREALALRLTRMTANTLNDFMRDRDRELRRAAALATSAKGKDRLAEFADSLILLISDVDADVVQAARTSLKALTDQDFGPEAGAIQAERTKMAAAWRAWWEGRKR